MAERLPEEQGVGSSILPSGIIKLLIISPREESNHYFELRKLASYPLNDEGENSAFPPFRRG